MTNDERRRALLDFVTTQVEQRGEGLPQTRVDHVLAAVKIMALLSMEKLANGEEPSLVQAEIVALLGWAAGQLDHGAEKIPDIAVLHSDITRILTNPS